MGGILVPVSQVLTVPLLPAHQNPSRCHRPRSRIERFCGIIRSDAVQVVMLLSLIPFCSIIFPYKGVIEMTLTTSTKQLRSIYYA